MSCICQENLWDGKGETRRVTPTGSARPPAALTSAHRPPPPSCSRTQRGYDLEPRSLSRRLRQDTDSSTRDAHAAICGQSTASDGPAQTPRAPGAAERRHARAGRGRGYRRSAAPPAPGEAGTEEHDTSAQLGANSGPPRPAAVSPINLFLPGSLGFSRSPLLPRSQAGTLPFALVRAAACLRFLQRARPDVPPWDGRSPPRIGTGTGTSVPPSAAPPPCAEESLHTVKTLPKPHCSPTGATEPPCFAVLASTTP